MLRAHIKAIQEAIRAGLFSNQASVSQGIILRLLQALDWPTFEINVVSPEYPINGRRVDFALCHPPGKPLIFIEVKPPGQAATGERQLFEYAFHKGVPMVILTDGQEWQFYLPAEPGDYGERRVYRLDIVERDIEESVRRLERYLHYRAVCSGEALESARADYKDVARSRLIDETLPIALKKIIEEEEEILLELIADQVESLCGYKPNLEVVGQFLKNNVNITSSTHKHGNTAIEASPQTKPVKSTLGPGVGFSLHGQWYPAKSARDVLVKVFEIFSKRDPSFCQRFASLPKHGTKRRFLAKTPEEIIPHRAKEARKFSYELSNGWWILVHLSRIEIKRILTLACKVANVKFGADLVVHLGD